MHTDKEREEQDNTSAAQVQLKNVCDFAYIDRMSSGNKDFKKEIIKLYLQQVPEELLKLQTAIITGDKAGIKGIAHKLKSSVSLLGAESVATRLKALELLSASETVRTEDFLQIFKELEELNDRAIEEELLPLLYND
ncbi:Hpt domain-containing protein [Pontibacter harenae]|uniref:Hpt domain-containing protein n=1 Tax=Pontibacter harenae TaxID=2894083 RepID=UPI001E2AC725|nr:Hpt domain-containing protein [Pontibacter harenae]MCC9167521.1 Hpt domain-containing protein [Pontibacter harenae]